MRNRHIHTVIKYVNNSYINRKIITNAYFYIAGFLPVVNDLANRMQQLESY